MGKKKIFTIGFELPGDMFERVSYDSDQSLLDADIVLYKVGFGTYPTEDYQGKPLFNHYYSARIADQLQHWRSELASATNAGKLVIIFLSSPRSYYRYTGEQQFSGTGRSRVDHQHYHIRFVVWRSSKHYVGRGEIRTRSSFD